MTSRGAIRAIARVDREIARHTFSRPEAIALGGWQRATVGRAWASALAFQDDVANGGVEGDVRAVMYDPEGWDATPPEERADFVPHVARFGRVARDHGWFSIVTPYWSLLDQPGAVLARDRREPWPEAYLRLRIPELVAPHIDCYENQAQRLQADPDAYRSLVSQAAAMARAANPRVVVLSGLTSTRPSRATPQQLFDAFQSVRDVVEGHYLSLGKRRAPEVAAAFLRMVANA